MRSGTAAFRRLTDLRAPLRRSPNKPPALPGVILVSSETRFDGDALADETGRVRHGRLDRGRSLRASDLGRASSSVRSGNHSAGAYAGSRAGKPLAEAGTDEAPTSRMRGCRVRRAGRPHCWLTARKNAHEGCRGRFRSGTRSTARSRCRQRRRRGHSTPSIRRAREGVDYRRLTRRASARSPPDPRCSRSL